MQLSYEVFHRDVAALVDFYVRVLGFGPPERSAPSDYAVVQRDAVRVGCCLHDQAESSPRRPPNGSEIVLRVDDVQAEYDRVVTSGWPMADGLQVRPWGMRDFRVFDPSGQYIRVTSFPQPPNAQATISGNSAAQSGSP